MTHDIMVIVQQHLVRSGLLPVPVQHAPARQVRVVQLVPRQVPVNAAAEHTPGITELEPVHALVVLEFEKRVKKVLAKEHYV